MRRQRKVRPASDVLIDQIKDSIDRLNEIRSKKKRKEAAQDLVEYIELHQIQYPS